MKCKHCGEEIHRLNEYFVHTEANRIACAAFTHAEPEEPTLKFIPGEFYRTASGSKVACLSINWGNAEMYPVAFQQVGPPGAVFRTKMDGEPWTYVVVEKMRVVAEWEEPDAVWLDGDEEQLDNAQPFCNGCKSRRDVEPKTEKFLVFHCYCASLGINIAGHPDPEGCGYEPDVPSVEDRLEKVEKWIERHIEENRP